ncbi:xanthine dehydrogenase family protein molybdopterin-binding subunit [Pontivivens insulae]|uniref:Carbon monoxide dehydrogenase large chain n=1 Tax=Pontivivens insulae TaxID=1639689 RepID=A0A2R8ADM3_9RHOB|nr:xanthine dehydrogenase family protein molybdopterin-binding subunit [Pontivivens insulae]RED14187.1 carbon-monoxide dehydrogenase large subunit [Pontivivens insulae]SPF30262.1 Carbon monoxide dehydrogenase large chain [Pontivivens insulae]
MAKFGVSQSVRRKEDDRFLTGQGRYVDDIAPAGSAIATFVRAPVAHARIESIDITDALEVEGVLAVYTAADLDGKLVNTMDASVVKNRDGSKGAAPMRPILAADRVCHAGEAVAMVVAETRQAGLDAAELVMVDYDDLPVHLDTAIGGDAIHAEAPDNIAYDWAHGDEARVAAIFDGAAHTVSLDLIDNRVFANPLEPRGCYAEVEGDRLHLALNGQGVWGTRDALAKKLGLDKSQVRVTNPDVGGGFGMKSFDYPEHFMTAFAARELQRPVRWMADRGEGHLTDAGGRDLVTTAEAAFDADHKLIALRFHTLSNLGGYNSGYGQFIQSELALKVMPGTYDVQDTFFHVQGIYTNTTPIDAYRGAGRPEAIYAIERLMDQCARELGVNPQELRRKNFIPKDAFPYTSAAGELYDVGDFHRVLDRAEVEADLAGFEARRAASAAEGKYRGLGLCYYIESILGSQDETTKIEFVEDGSVNLYVGTQSNGQGHETVFAQILHERAGIPFEAINFVQGDSDRIAKGGGTGGSRSVTMQGNSINATADEMIRKYRPLAEEELEVASADIEFDSGQFKVVGTDKGVSLMDLAAKAREKAMAELLVTELENTVAARSFPNGAHFAEVEVDPDTGKTQVVKYTVVDDFGVLMNPMLAEGQVHGGVAQGIGQAITEQVVYDEDGQLMSGSFMDYAMPRAYDVPWMHFHTELVPSTANEIGMKGCGEAGTVGALAAVTNAALDAVWEAGVRHIDMPLTPVRMWTWLNEANRHAAE